MSARGALAARRCRGISTIFAAAGSAAMLPALLISPVLLALVFPLGLLWLIAVVVPGVSLTLRHYRYVLELRVSGGRSRLWARSALLPAIYAAGCMYASVLGGPPALALLTVPLVGLCLLALAAYERDVARPRDRRDGVLSLPCSIPSASSSKPSQ